MYWSLSEMRYLLKAGDICDDNCHQAQQADATAYVNYYFHHLKHVSLHFTLILKSQQNKFYTFISKIYLRPTLKLFFLVHFPVLLWAKWIMKKAVSKISRNSKVGTIFIFWNTSLYYTITFINMIRIIYQMITFFL